MVVRRATKSCQHYWEIGPTPNASGRCRNCGAQRAFKAQEPLEEVHFLRDSRLEAKLFTLEALMELETQDTEDMTWWRNIA